MSTALAFPLASFGDCAIDSLAQAGGGANVVPTVIGFLIGLMFGTLIATVFMRGAVAMTQKVAGEDAIETPEFGEAFVSMLISTFVTLVGGFAAGFVIGLASGGVITPLHNLLAQLSGLAIGAVVYTLTVSARHDATPGVAFLVWIFHMLLLLATAVVIGGTLFAAGLIQL